MGEENQKPDSKLTENIAQMLARHRREIIDLHSKCEHKKFTAWRPAPDKQGGMFRACVFCGKVERTRLVSPVMGVNPHEQRSGV